jgi:hypothetical protein
VREVEALLAGVRREGVGRWAAILKGTGSEAFNAVRTSVDLKDKWRNLASPIREKAVAAGEGGNAADGGPASPGAGDGAGGADADADAEHVAEHDEEEGDDDHDSGNSVGDDDKYDDHNDNDDVDDKEWYEATEKDAEERPQENQKPARRRSQRQRLPAQRQSAADVDAIAPSSPVLSSANVGESPLKRRRKQQKAPSPPTGTRLAASAGSDSARRSRSRSRPTPASGIPRTPPAVLTDCSSVTPQFVGAHVTQTNSGQQTSEQRNAELAAPPASTAPLLGDNTAVVSVGVNVGVVVGVGGGILGDGPVGSEQHDVHHDSHGHHDEAHGGDGPHGGDDGLAYLDGQFGATRGGDGGDELGFADAGISDLV